MLDRLHDMVLLPARALSAVHRRRRCEVCRSRMTAKTYGRRSARCPPARWLFVDAPPRRGGYARLQARYLCDGCRERNDRAGAARQEELDRQFARTVQRYTAWLRAAPLLTRLPAEVGTFGDGGDGPFVEILDLDTVAEQFAEDVCHREARGVRLNHHHPRHRSSKRMPSWYEDVAMRQFPVRPGSQDTWVWTGSVFRLDDGRIALYWHTYREDCTD